jgi:hypothetical protein
VKNVEKKQFFMFYYSRVKNELSSDRWLQASSNNVICDWTDGLLSA